MIDEVPISLNADLSIFEMDWWLDAVAPDRWRVALVHREGRVAARMPYVLKRVGPFEVVANPPYTPVLGPWLYPVSGKHEHRMSVEMELMTALVSQLPQVDLFVQSLSPRMTNWLPFYWKVFHPCYGTHIE